jgi:hypothetical protein
MTRFDAADATDRRKLVADAVTAHRRRGSPFLTVEGELADDDAQTPWIQFAEDTLNMDCTDEELSRLEDLLEDYPEFRIDSAESPDDVDGTNVRVTARSDANRIAGFVDRAFQAVYGLDPDYRAWVVQI